MSAERGGHWAASPRVYLEVDSLRPVEVIRPAVVGWLDGVWQQTLAPLARALDMVTEVGVLAEPPDRWRRVRSDRVWREALATLATPEGKFLKLGAGEIERGLTLSGDLPYREVASKLCVRLSVALAKGDEWPALQNRLLAHFAAAAEATDASTGFIDGDEEGAETSYEWDTNRTEKQGLAESSRWLRGVFWCTLLSRGHLDRLGGIDRVEREAPAALTRRLQSPNGPLLLLQASDDLATCNREMLAPLYEFLAPVLPPPTKSPNFPDRPPEPPRPDPTVEVDPDIDADISVRLIFDGSLDEADRATLDQLFDAWYVLAIHGVFGDSVHNMDSTAYDRVDKQTICTVGIDLGNAGINAVDPLVRLLAAASDGLKAPLLRIIVAEDTAD